MPSPELCIPIHDLDAAGRHFSFTIPSGWIRGVLEGTGVSAAGPDGDLDVRASKSGSDVVIRGVLSAELSVPCARCLEPACIRVREELSALAVPFEPTSAEDETELTGDESDTIPFVGDNVVLDDWVRDELLLGVPIVPLCSESCPGIRPEPAPDGHAGPAADVDPRLAPLLKLRGKT